MRRNVYVPLDQHEVGALVRLAEREDRDPRHQAARLLREALRQAGTLTADDQLTPAAPPTADHHDRVTIPAATVRG